jgi:hypothetical protein
MTTRAKSRSKFSRFPAIQDELTPLFETYSTEDCFEKLSHTPGVLKAATLSLKDIAKQSVSKYGRTVVSL